MREMRREQPTRSDIAEDLVRARQARGHSQSQAAEEMAVSVDTVQNWEQGRRRPHGLYARAARRYIAAAQGKGDRK